MGAQGSTTINFGAWPGALDATAVITGQTSITGTSLVEAWLMPVATSDHSADEHIYDPPMIMAGNVVAGTGFTIYGIARQPPFIASDGVNGGKGPLREYPSQNEVRPYGEWTVAWVWN